VSARPPTRKPDRAEVVRAAEFRLRLRRFLASSDRVVRRVGLTPRRYLLLLTLEAMAAEGRTDIAVGDLAERLGLPDSTMTGLLERAQDAGLLERRTAPHDARVVHVRATRRGRRLFAVAFAAHRNERDLLARDIAVLGKDPQR
jgi:DNA-binding MarR family transcriptional regulator